MFQRCFRSQNKVPPELWPTFFDVFNTEWPVILTWVILIQLTFYVPEKCSSMSHRPCKVSNLMNTPQFNPFRANYRKIYLGDFEVEFEIMLGRWNGDFF